MNDAPLGQGYEPRPFFDEMFEAPDAVRPHYRLLFDELRRLAPAGFEERRRSLGLPARYVSGYVHAPDSPTSAASHAWVDVFLPARRWISLDPTHDCGQTVRVRIESA